jgi:hypothetical protein
MMMPEAWLSATGFFSHVIDALQRSLDVETER